MSGTVGAHNELHSERGARPGEHRGRARNPVIKVADIAWLEFEKPDLDRDKAPPGKFVQQVLMRPGNSAIFREGGNDVFEVTHDEYHDHIDQRFPHDVVDQRLVGKLVDERQMVRYQDDLADDERQ